LRPRRGLRYNGPFCRQQCCTFSIGLNICFAGHAQVAGVGPVSVLSTGIANGAAQIVGIGAGIINLTPTWDSGATWDSGLFWDSTSIPDYSTAYYLARITSEYNQQPNFVSALITSIQPYSETIQLLQNIPTLFQLSTAVGDQLTKLGELIGVSRYVEIPLTNVYFSLDSATLGLDQGSMQGEFDPSEGLTSLPDNVYLLLIQAQILLNKWDGTIPGLYAALSSLLTGLVIQDFGNKQMFYGLTKTQPTPLLNQLFLDGYFNLAPAGVQVLAPAISSPSGTPFFGLDAETSAVAGLDVGYMP
jgi:hypothetical protein